MANALLDPEEKRRFSEWLQIQIDSSKGMLSQFNTLPKSIAEPLIWREKKRVEAFVVVHEYINSGEAMTVGGK